MNSVCVVGSFMMDLIARAPRRPHAGETIAGHSFEIHAGGKGFNQAIAARRYGAQVAFVGVLGNDSFGDEFVAHMDSHSIDHSHVRRHPTDGTGVGLPVVDDTGENSIIIIPRANSALSPADIRMAASAIRDADVLLLQLEVPIPAALEAVRIAHDAETLVILNPAPYCTVPQDLLSLVDLIVPNAVEARHFIGVDSPSDELVDAFRRIWTRDAVITLGADGAVAVDGSTVTSIPPYAVVPVDTVGAGDTFCGVLGACLANGDSLGAATEQANGAAALAVTRRGSSTAIPTRAEVEAFRASAIASHRAN